MLRGSTRERLRLVYFVLAEEKKGPSVHRYNKDDLAEVIIKKAIQQRVRSFKKDDAKLDAKLGAMKDMAVDDLVPALQDTFIGGLCTIRFPELVHYFLGYIGDAIFRFLRLCDSIIDILRVWLAKHSDLSDRLLMTVRRPDFLNYTVAELIREVVECATSSDRLARQSRSVLENTLDDECRTSSEKTYEVQRSHMVALRPSIIKALEQHSHDLERLIDELYKKEAEFANHIMPLVTGELWPNQYLVSGNQPGPQVVRGFRVC